MKLAFDETGNGPALILVHGLGATGNLWGGMVPTLARQFRVVCPDLRGSGRTTRVGDISTETLAGDLLELANGLGIEKAHWVGHSYGSVVLQHLAVEQPSRVLSLALIGPIQSASEAARPALAARAAKARAEGLAEIGSATAQVGTSAETKAHRPELAAFVRELVMRQDPESYAMTCEAVARSAPASIGKLRCPTLVITGDEDMTSPAPVAKAIADQIGGAHFQVLPRCGHWTPLERTRELTDQLLNFLLGAGTSHASQR
jgi:3-oxoadipate enol-lactonase